MAALIGGIPNEILYDRMKVIGEAGGSIVYNRALIDFARHYGFQPKACRPYRAKAKGKVERPYRYIREDFFLARSFRHLDDLNAQSRHWLDTVASSRVGMVSVGGNLYSDKTARAHRSPSGCGGSQPAPGRSRSSQDGVDYRSPS
jgi:hypothetical protein